jgi:predicted dinucleotide-binding enzyme
MQNFLARLFGKKNTMTDITIIGNGNMARGIATRAIAAGKKVEILGQDAAKAQALANELGADISFGTTAGAPQGSIVVLAVPFDAAKAVVSAYGDQLAGKTVVDITNPVNFETFDSLVVEPGSSAAEEIAALAPAGVNVVKAFNTTFASTLVAGESGGKPLDVFIAGDNAEATQAVSSFVSAAGMRPLVVGPLKRSRELEGFQFVVMTMQANPAFADFNWDTGLAITK